MITGDAGSSSSSSIGSGVPMASPNRLNLLRLRAEFAACVKDSEDSKEDIVLSHYVNAYTELLQIVRSLGRVFYFVVQDVQDKLNILSEYLLKEPHNYRSLETMAHFERDNNRFTSKFPTNGSRTYLRLHRALLFIFRLIQELVNASSCAQGNGKASTNQATKLPSLGEMTQTVYTETLSQYHAWIVRKGVLLAVHALPSRDDFLATLCRESGMEDRDALLKFLQDALPAIHDAYTISQHIYASNNLLNLE